MISGKQLEILTFPYNPANYDALICDGAVRSGKTSIMTVSFIMWAMETFNNQRFGICGKTVDSCVKNIIVPFISTSHAKTRYRLKWRRSDKILEVKRGGITNWFEVFGGKDESSYALIQGRTLAGVLLDEVALMPQSFVNQALARCSVDGAKMWFSCNPDNPNHWFYTDWIQQCEKRNALYLHFEMSDNPSLSPKTLERYQTMYTGVFYERYILGRWVVAEGLVYPMFDKNVHVVHTLPETSGEYYVSSDFGIENASVFLLWRKELSGNRWCCIDEYYYSGRETKTQKTVGELVDGLAAMLGDIMPKRIIVDPSAAALIVELRKRGYHTQPADNDVLNGISDVCTMLKDGKLLFSDRCKGAIKEFGLYAWDEKRAAIGEDAPVKTNDHAMDAIRYFVHTMKLVRKDGKKTETLWN
jgi:PBSX family phage terminase large subunit